MADSVETLKLKLKVGESYKGEQRRVLYLQVRNSIREIQQMAAKDFSYPLSEIKGAAKLLPEVETVINRLSRPKKK